MKLLGKTMIGWISLFAFLWAGSPIHAEVEPHVEIFSPQGTVKGVRQVRVQFSEPMVPFGDPGSLIDPFEIACPVKGAGRWVDPGNWTYDFEQDLSAGVRCEFRLRPETRTLSGKPLTGENRFSFSTGGPAIRSSNPYEGAEEIDEEQIFILTLDTEPDEASVLQHVTFSVEGIQDQIGVRIVGGKEREALFKSRFRYRRPPFPPLIFIQAKQHFPNDCRVSLVWGKEVTSRTGVSGEKDQVLRFKTRRPFLLEFTCERENPRAACIPVTPMRLQFSSPVARELASRIVMKGPEGKIWPFHLGGDREANFVDQIIFTGPFPEKASFTIEIPPDLKDEGDRTPVNGSQFPLRVQTDRYPPLAKFSARFGILELKSDPTLPVTLRNLEPLIKGKVLKVEKGEGPSGKLSGKVLNLSPGRGEEIQAWLRRAASASRENSLFSNEKGIREIRLPKPMGTGAFEVVGIPLKDPGLYIVELESALLGEALLDEPRPMYVPTAVLVTDLSAHFKWGRESSLVWVTTLHTAEPVRDAWVTVRDCQGKILWNGKTDSSGIARINVSLPPPSDLPECSFKMDQNDSPQMKALHSLWGGLFITAETRDDMTFVHSGWDEGIEPWRFQLPEESDLDPVLVHTLFDRTLLRAGETVHMKHLLRRHTTKGFSMVPQAQWPAAVSIEHFGSGQKYEFPLKWDGGGVAETTWTIPREAKLGRYAVLLREPSEEKEKKTGRAGGGRTWTSGTFRVEEFRIPLLRGMLQAPDGPFVRAEELTLDGSVQYLAGGGAGLLPVRLRGEIGPKYVPPFEGYPDFFFASGPVKEGILRRGESLESEEESEEEGLYDQKRIQLPTRELALDASGSLRTKISPLPQTDFLKEILTEMEFKDPNGEIQTVSTRIPLWPSKVLVGIKPDSWALSKEAFKFHVAVVDLAGKPVPSAPVRVDLFERKTYSHRKRLVGGFYAYDHSAETRRLATVCEGKTDPAGLLICEAQSPVSGSVILEAQSVDEAGNRSLTHREVWVAGKGEWWFEAGDHDRIDLIPERKRYEPGETATFQVRMPFRTGTALISVEREGVMETWIKKISGKNPVIEIPVRSPYAPNVFVSCLVVRGRLPWIKPTSMIDLGKPGYKLGIGEIQVGWKAHELKVHVTTDRRIYRVRQKARAKIKVTTFEGKPPPAGSEVTVAAVDEGLLELMPNRSWEVLPAMMGRRGYGVRTATAQMQVIGKRHFGLKAHPQGGGGGRQSTRELFDTLLLWKGRLPLNAEGEAALEIPLNDSITGFRIVAVATGGAGLFGTGTTSIQSTQELMVLSGLPPLVREGDRYLAGFTVRNTTRRNMEVEVQARAEGLAQPLNPVSLSLMPGEARETGWDVRIPPGIEALRWEVEVREKATNEADRIRTTQRVVPVIPVRTFQATLARLERTLQFPVERPQDALPGRGGINVALRPKIGDGLSGVLDYMKQYPYTCLEQRISVAVALRDEKRWRDVVALFPSHLDADGFLKYFATATYGCPVLTSYLLAIAHEAEWKIPDEVREKMETALVAFVEGKIVRHSVLQTADLMIRKLSALEALSRYQKADSTLLNSLSIDPNLWPTSALIDWINILQRGSGLQERDRRKAEAEQILRSRLSFQGTQMGFSTEASDRLWWLMVSNDVNAVRIILSLLHSEEWKGELPRILQGALARQKRGRWDLTVANAWGVLALEKFSKKVEAVPVTGATRVRLSRQSQTVDWKALPKGGVSSFPWRNGREELSLAHDGTGQPWVTVQSLAAIPLKEPLSSGYRIKKTLFPIEQKERNRWSKGDLLRIRLEVEAQADQTWVVVDDPIPAGATILGKGLSGDSDLLRRGEERKGWVWPSFEERSFEAFRSYYEYVPKGQWMVEYTIRLNQGGTFRLPNTRVEALYSPEMFGEMPNRVMEVHP